jgi:hypothetical protein
MVWMVPLSSTSQSCQIEVVSRFELAVVISMAWSYSVRPVVEIYLICARSAAGSAGRSLGAKFRFPNREMVSFERERLRKGWWSLPLDCRSALSRSFEAERGPLVGPGHRQIHQSLASEPARQMAFYCRGDDGGGGATKASDNVIRIERSLLRSRPAMVSMVWSGSVISSFSQQ